jgi:hypothetical protein
MGNEAPSAMVCTSLFCTVVNAAAATITTRKGKSVFFMLIVLSYKYMPYYKLYTHTGQQNNLYLYSIK